MPPCPKGSPIFLDSPFREGVENRGKSVKYYFCRVLTNNLEYIPEAHNYLKIGNDYFDFTNYNSSYSEVENRLLIETEIEFNEINLQKTQNHKEFLTNWIKDKSQFTLEHIWEIRESCISDLQH